MKPSSLPKNSLKYGQALGLALTVSGLGAKLLNDKGDPLFCHTNAEPNIVCSTLDRTHLSCEEGTPDVIAKIRDEMKRTQQQVKDVTPLSGKLLGVKVQKTYAPDFKVETVKLGGVPDQQCESLQPIIRIKDENRESHPPATLKEEITVATNNLNVAISGLILSFSSLLLSIYYNARKLKKVQKNA